LLAGGEAARPRLELLDELFQLELVEEEGGDGALPQFEPLFEEDDGALFQLLLDCGGALLVLFDDELFHPELFEEGGGDLELFGDDDDLSQLELLFEDDGGAYEDCAPPQLFEFDELDELPLPQPDGGFELFLLLFDPELS